VNPAETFCARRAPIAQTNRANAVWRGAIVASCAAHVALLAAPGLLPLPRMARPRASIAPLIVAMAPVAPPAPEPSPPDQIAASTVAAAAQETVASLPALASLTTPAPSPVARPHPSVRQQHRATLAANTPAPQQLSPALPPAAPPPAAMTPDALNTLTARIHQAVQAALVYPPAARMMRLAGRTQIRFEYEDGAARAVLIARSSRSDLLDDAALAAVRRAAMPPVPQALRGCDLNLLVWVDFGIS
jgi:protein TonB